MNADSDLMASRSAYCYGDSSVPNIADPNGTDAVWITSFWYLVVPFGHTSLLIEDEETGIWYYTMYASNAVLMPKVPSKCTEDIGAFNEYFRGDKFLKVIPAYWRDYTTATYIEGDFSAALSHFRTLRNEFKKENEGKDNPVNSDYDLLINNCVTMSLKLVEMGVTRDGIPMKKWMENRCLELGIDYPNFFIPNFSTAQIATIFDNGSFTKPKE